MKNTNLLHSSLFTGKSPYHMLVFCLTAILLIQSCQARTTGWRLSSTSNTDTPTSTRPEPFYQSISNFTPTISLPSLTPTRSTSTPTPTATQTPTPAPMVCTPLDGHTLQDLLEIVSNPFSPPAPGKDDGHHGVDFSYYRHGNRLSIEGVTIQAVLAGRVAAVVDDKIPYGNMVIIETPYADLPAAAIDAYQLEGEQSLYLLYAHMKTTPALELGQAVSCGQALGEVGNTPKGWSSFPHLHFEVRVGPVGVSFTGMEYYSNAATSEEMDNYKRWRMSGDFHMKDPLRLLSTGLPASK